MYRLIACDMDETLLNREHQISARDIESIRKLTASGVKFVIATGRPYNSVFNDLKVLGLYEKEDEYVISFNGSVLTENRHNRILSYQSLSFETASLLYRIGVENGVCIHVYTIDTVYVYNYIPEERAYIEGRMNNVETFEKTLDFLKDVPVIKVLFMNLNMDILHRLEAVVRAQAEELSISYSSNRYLEFNCLGIDKGYGLSKLAALLNIPIEETIAVGDNINDLPMIRAAGLGIAVRNGNPQILPDCDVVLQATNNDDPLTEIRERFF
ncbi:MAG: HAD family phosphatase [Erysipelotrichaceae bacterium]|nr:HAD family phosphatase [Erysipelotrichaceae bacterium]